MTHLKSFKKFLRMYGPSTHKKPIALVPIVQGRADASVWSEMQAIQIVGGKKWSLSFIRKTGCIHIVNPDGTVTVHH